jgi:hypothetical protein
MCGSELSGTKQALGLIQSFDPGLPKRLRVQSQMIELAARATPHTHGALPHMINDSMKLVRAAFAALIVAIANTDR